jgi:hypothetical protein
MDDSPIQTALCVIGHPIGGNPTQFVAMRALAALGLDWQFVSFDVEPARISEAIMGIDSLGFGGAMIASPYQTEVRRFLVAVADQASEKSASLPDVEAAAAPPAKSQAPSPGHQADFEWHDCLVRDQAKRLTPINLYAQSLRSLIDRHTDKIGQELQWCLILVDGVQHESLVLPLKEQLPPERFAVAGALLKAWPLSNWGPNTANQAVEAASAASSVASPEAASTELTPAPASAAHPDIHSLPALVILALDNKPRKKSGSKASPLSPSPAFVGELIAQLHPDSLVVDLVGSAAGWLEERKEDGRLSLEVVTTVELELAKLFLALKRWTGREPNMDVMREAIEEYLEV